MGVRLLGLEFLEEDETDGNDEIAEDRIMKTKGE